MTLKIIAGKFKDYKIFTHKNIRPVTSTIRSAIFNICRNPIENANFLDLFAGSGSIGLEALSRGAKFSTFIDKDPISIKIIKKNIKKLNIQNITKVICCDAIKFLKNNHEIFDIISVDPPFEIYKKKPSYINILLNFLILHINKNSIIFLEEPTYSKRTFNIDTLILKNKRKYSSAFLLEYILK